MNWRDKLDKFMASFEHKADVIGVLVCGSFEIDGFRFKSSVSG